MMATYEPAITFARQWLALDRLNETAHGQLMRLYAWSGQRSAALRQYQECVAVLREQLGAAPQESLTFLYESIREGVAPRPPQPHQPHFHRRRRRPTCAGRPNSRTA